MAGWMVVVGGWALGCSSDGGPVGEVIRRVAQADSVFARVHTRGASFSGRGGTHDAWILRLEPGTLAIDHERGSERLLIDRGRVWLSHRQRSDRFPEAEQRGVAALAHLQLGLAMGRVRPAEASVYDDLDLPDTARAGWLYPPLGIADLGRVLVVVEGDVPTRIRIMDGHDRVVALGLGRPLDLRVDYWREDVPLEDDWDEVRPGGTAPLLRALAGPKDPDLERYPYAAHERFHDLRLIAAGHGTGIAHRQSRWSYVDLEEPCAYPDAVPSSTETQTLAPERDGNPWRDARAAMERSCAWSLEGSFLDRGWAHRSGRHRACGSQHLVARVGEGADMVVLGTASSPSNCPTVQSRQYPPEWSIPFPGPPDLETLRVDWTTIHELRCASPVTEDMSGGASAITRMDVRLRWDCGDSDTVGLKPSSLLRQRRP